MSMFLELLTPIIIRSAQRWIDSILSLCALAVLHWDQSAISDKHNVILGYNL